MEKKLYPREKYLSRIRPFYHDTEMIKFFSGVRRCGKSSLLLLVQEELRHGGVADRNILSVNLDKRPYTRLKTTDALERVIDERFAGVDGVKYLFIDEVQNVNFHHRQQLLPLVGRIGHQADRTLSGSGYVDTHIR